MKAILILIAAMVLTSCAMGTHCPTYTGTNRSNSHYKKIHTAKHIKPRKSLI